LEPNARTQALLSFGARRVSVADFVLVEHE